MQKVRLNNGVEMPILGFDVSQIPDAVEKERMVENFDLFDFELSADDLNTINTLDTNESLFFDHRDSKMVKWLIEYQSSFIK